MAAPSKSSTLGERAALFSYKDFHCLADLLLKPDSLSDAPFGRRSETEIPAEMRDELLADLSERFRPEDYRLLSHNCNTFSNEFAQLLCGVGIPAHITGLPDEVRGREGAPARRMSGAILGRAAILSLRQEAYYLLRC